MLNEDGRVVVITFHSLEDRLAKNIMREKTTIDYPINVPVIGFVIDPNSDASRKTPRQAYESNLIEVRRPRFNMRL